MSGASSGLRCICGGHALAGSELYALAGQEDPEGIGWVNYWRSIVGPDDIYCIDEDDVLTEEEAWRVRFLKLPVHDEPDPAEDLEFDVLLTFDDVFGEPQ